MQFAVGFSVGFLVFFFGTLFTTANFGAIWMPIVGWLLVIGIAMLLTVLVIKKKKQLKAEYALNSVSKEKGVKMAG